MIIIVNYEEQPYDIVGQRCFIIILNNRQTIKPLQTALWLPLKLILRIRVSILASRYIRPHTPATFALCLRLHHHSVRN